jgi:hypothetical protein
MNEPAFPTPSGWNHEGKWVQDSCDFNGMTLRDYFAAKAMQAFIHGFAYREDKDNIVIPNNLSQHAYVMANLMMEARK